MKSVLLIDRTPSVFRIREMAEAENIRLIEVRDETSAIKTVRQIGAELDMVIIDIMLEFEDDGFEIMKKIAELEPDLSMTILTSNGQRQAIAHGLKLGAKDYILKPFDNETIKNRIFSKMIDRIPFTGATGTKNKEEIMSILGSEVIKSRKGKYPLTIMLSTYYNANQTTKWVRNPNYGIHTVDFAASIKEIMFQTDYVYPFEGNTVLSILPFCDEEKLRIVDDKARERGISILESLERDGYLLSNAYLTFPMDDFDGSADEVIEILFSKLSELIAERKESIYSHSREVESAVGAITDPNESVKELVEKALMA